MVEAAMVFPLVIFTVLALIGMLLFFFRQVEAQCKLDMAVRQASGASTETVFCLEREGASYSISKEGSQIICGRENIEFAEQGLLKNIDVQLQAKAYLVECGAWIRKCDRLMGKNSGVI